MESKKQEVTKNL